ncbi:hypothetical protein T310_10063 [Rasamsonia emersonii CBS 393.64]|uniref:Uncharacterized protein n=1 Tax=Rasamsonia emersonii (strain ATCC 16479 / CBS 393.64 / IMI 116815) TaxID=1408163 RepID=A0A0F4YDU2_RASE3|nr:hypothetical protein T310_10063 [Rasamsonia emersonii CBS 393.64]KKA16349.1 hypothetical protein T310_10063 [Rasamsonia emersonii CBS 393.64]
MPPMVAHTIGQSNTTWSYQYSQRTLMVTYARWLAIPYGGQDHMFAVFLRKLWCTMWPAAPYGCPYHRTNYTTGFAVFLKIVVYHTVNEPLWLPTPYG